MSISNEELSDEKIDAGTQIKSKVTENNLSNLTFDMDKITHLPDEDYVDEMITIPLDEYKYLLNTQGRYDEIKEDEEDSKEMMEEYKNLLVIKGKYEELLKRLMPNDVLGPIMKLLVKDLEKSIDNDPEDKPLKEV